MFDYVKEIEDNFLPREEFIFPILGQYKDIRIFVGPDEEGKIACQPDCREYGTGNTTEEAIENVLSEMNLLHRLLIKVGYDKLDKQLLQELKYLNTHLIKMEMN